MTIDEAKAIKPAFKSANGMTLGELAINKPSSIDWIVNEYAGPKNMIKAGAIISWIPVQL